MNIVLVGPFHPYRGGNALFMAHLYKALSRDYDVQNINYTLLYPGILFPGKTQYDVSDQHYDREPSIRMVNSINPITWWKTARYINKMNPDLVAFDWWQPFFGPCQFGISLFLKKSLKKKVVLVCENFVSHEKRWIERILLKFGIFYPKAFISLSETVRKEIANTVGNRPVFKTEIPIYGWYRQDDGFDMAAEKKRYGWAPEDRVFLFFGYVRKYKGVDILIDAFAKLADKHPDLRLIVAGEFYDNPKEYEDLIKAHGLEDKIKLVNEFVPNEEVARYFRVCEMVVLPYRSGTQSGILNMAYGFQKPVVITDVGGLVETVDDGKTGVIVRQPTPDGVAEGMEKYLQLNETTDFATNIANKIQENNFDKVNAIFAELLTKFNA